MRTGIALFVVVLLVGSGLALLMERENGYLLIAVGNTTIEMSLVAALLALLLLWGLVRLLLKLLGSLKMFAGWRRAHLSRRRAQTAQGLLYYIEGRWERARRQLVRGVEQSDMPLVNYLAAASAAFEEGNSEAAQTLLAKAEQLSDGDVDAVEITRARLHIKAQRYEEALAILKRIHSRSPLHTHVLRLLEQTYRGLNDWLNLQQLLPELRRYGGYSRQQFEALEVAIYARLLNSLAERAGKADTAAQQQLEQLWHSMSAAVKRSPEVVCSYSDYLQSRGDGELAEKLLHNTLNNHWDDRLIRRYGLLVGGDLNTQLVIAEAWLRERPNNPALLLALGRLAQRAELWGKARDYLEAALSLSREPEVFAELARLMSQLGEVDKSAAYYQQGLLQSAQL